MDVCSSNLTPYCHVYVPYITDFVIDASHQRSQPTPSYCAMCEYVECHLLILILHLKSLVHAYTISHGKVLAQNEVLYVGFGLNVILMTGGTHVC